MILKRLRVELKDLFVEFKEEKLKLLKEINLLKDYRNCLNSFVISCKCDQNVINGNKFLFNQLESHYLNAFGHQLVAEYKGLDIAAKDVLKDNGINDKTNVVENNEIIEEIINENILDIDCRQLSDSYIVNMNPIIQLEVIPKKEKEEIIDLTEDEPIVEPIIQSIPQQIIEDIPVFDMSQEKDVFGLTEPKTTDNSFNFLTSLISQTKSCVEIKDNLNEFNEKQNSGKTIVVEKNKKIIGFVCNIESCPEFYKSITGLQSHIDRVHKQTNKQIQKSPIWTVIDLNLDSPQTDIPSDDIKSRSVAKKSTASKKKAIIDSNYMSRVRVKNEEKTNDKKKKINKYDKYRCNYTECTASFNTKYQLIYHKFEKHKNGRKFRCKQPDCQLMFNSKYDVIQHLRKHSINSTKEQKKSKNAKLRQFGCGFMDCELIFNTQLELKQHKIESKHANKQTVNGFGCPTNGCDLSFKSKYELNKHLRQTDHSKERKILVKTKTKPKRKPINKTKPEIKCDKCERSFKSRFALYQHSKRSDHKSVLTTNSVKKVYSKPIVTHLSVIDKSKRKFICLDIDCKLGFNSRFALRQHLKRSNHNCISTINSVKKIDCKQNADQIVATDLDKREFKCPNISCDLVFTTRFALNQHLKSCRAVKYTKCEVKTCNYRFDNWYKLKAHIMSYHKLNPLKCSVSGCALRFKTRIEKSKHFKKCH